MLKLELSWCPKGMASNELLLLLNGDFSVFSKFHNLTSVAMNTNNFLVLAIGRSKFSTSGARIINGRVVARMRPLFLNMDSYNKIVVEHPRIAIKLVTKIASIIHNRGDNMTDHVPKLN